MSLDRLLSIYGQPVQSWPGEQDLDEEAKANLAAQSPVAQPKLRQDETFRGTFLPFRETTDGRHEWAVPGFLQDVWDAAKAVRDTSGTGLGPMPRPSQYSPEMFEQILGHGMAGALTGITGNIPRLMAKPPAGTIDFGIFGGRRGAETLAAKGEPRPLQAMDLLEQMEKAGASREEIWQATGEVLKDTPYIAAFRGVDKMPKFEIPDNGDYREGTGALYRPGKLRSEILDQGASKEGIAASGFQGNLDQVLEHKPLYDAYPALARTAWASVPAEKMIQPAGGVWMGQGRGMQVNANISPALKSGKSVTLHEVQHGVQDVEGFAKGANPEMFKHDVDAAQKYLLAIEDARFVQGKAREWGVSPDEAVARIEEQYGRKPGLDAYKKYVGQDDATLTRWADSFRRRINEARDPQGTYHRQAGEAEARAVQSRMDLSPEERLARPPWLDYDVPESQQIVRFGNEGMSNAAKPPLDMSPEARLARAREMGFDVDRKWYHGTDAKFDGFDLAHAGKTDWGFMGSGVYFTPDAKIARRYGTNVGDYYVRGAIAEDGNATADAIKRAAWSDAKKVASEKGLADHDEVSFVRDRVNQALADAGYTGRFDGDELVVFDPSNIRSVNADFDPSLSSSPNIMASMGDEGGRGALLTPEELAAAGYNDRAYHGTRSGFTGDFSDDAISPSNMWGRGHYATTKGDKAGDYALGENVNRVTERGDGDAPNVRPVRMRGPFLDLGALAPKMDAMKIAKKLDAAEKDPQFKKYWQTVVKDAYRPGGRGMYYHDIWQAIGAGPEDANAFFRSLGYRGIKDSRSYPDYRMVFTKDDIKHSMRANGGTVSPIKGGEAAKPTLRRLAGMN